MGLMLSAALVGMPLQDPARSHCPHRCWQGLRRWASGDEGGGGSGSREQPGNGVEDVIISIKASFITEESRARVPACLCPLTPSPI